MLLESNTVAATQPHDAETPQATVALEVACDAARVVALDPKLCLGTVERRHALGARLGVAYFRVNPVSNPEG